MTCEDKVVFDSPQWKNYSRECIDLIFKLLNKNPENRISLEKVLTHPWFDKLSKDFDKSMGAITSQQIQKTKFQPNYVSITSPTARHMIEMAPLQAKS